MSRHGSFSIQLLSCNYAPEPLGVGPVSRAFAVAMRERGHAVRVVAAHPHYPAPEWGARLMPYRGVRDGIPELRLPILPGRGTARRRLVQEASYAASLAAAVPALGRPDLVLAVSPSFPALLPVMLHARSRRIPWGLWLQDILPDGAAATGYLDRGGLAFRLASRLERAAYESAGRIFVLSDSFARNLAVKGVPAEKVVRAYNPATLPVLDRFGAERAPGDPPRILCMGNIGRSQALPAVVRAFEGSPELESLRTRLVITGDGVAAGEVRRARATSRVELPGVLPPKELERELRRASLALVSQAYEGNEFNVPSKLMNYLASGLPVLVSARRGSEAARIVASSDAGWVVEPGDARAFGATAAAALSDPAALAQKAANGLRFARRNLAPAALAETIEAALRPLIADS